MKRVRSKLTYANVMSSLAVFLVLGGGAYAAAQLPKNSVGARQLKKNAVTSAKIKNRSVRGVDIEIASLPKVPSAESADRALQAGSADSATHATGAASADRALNADSARHATSAASADRAASAASADRATSAASADDAGALGGAPADAYRRSCPDGELLSSVGTGATPACQSVGALALAGGSTPPQLTATNTLLTTLEVHLAARSTLLVTGTPSTGQAARCPPIGCTIHFGLYLDGQPMAGSDQARSGGGEALLDDFTAIQGLATEVPPGDHEITAHFANTASGYGVPLPIPSPTLTAVTLSE